MRKLIYISLLCGMACAAFPQQKMNVQGTVAFADGMQVKQTELSVLYTNIATKVGNKGTFTLKNVWLDDTIRVALNKQQMALFPVRGKATMQLAVQENLLTVMYGDGTEFSTPFLPWQPDEDKRAGSMITARMIERNVFRSLEQCLRGMVPGLNFSYTEGGEVLVNMRGSNSLKVASNALVLVNGAETTFNDANNSLEVYDIESIQVHKDGMGYGLKGSGGVIVIKTKGHR